MGIYAESDGRRSGRHDWAYFEIDSEKDDIDSPPSGSGSPMVFIRSQAGSTQQATCTSRNVSTGGPIS